MEPLLRKRWCRNRARLPSDLHFFGDAQDGEEGGTTFARSSTVLVAGSVLSRWWFGCPGSCTPPSQGALALPATAPGIREGERQETCGSASPPVFGFEIPVSVEKKV